MKGGGDKLHIDLKRFFLSENIEYFGALSAKDLRLTFPELALRDGIEPRSAIVYLVPYYGGETVNLSRYAAARDYHLYIRELNNRLSEYLSSVLPGSSCKGYGDHSPIDERHAALTLGLGVAGKNGLILNEKYGSYVFIGDMLTDIPPEYLSASAPRAIKPCIGCGKCISACPTGILGGKGEDCLSAITQKKGELSEREISLMRKYNTAWGCDECQITCPYNAEGVLSPIRFFLEDRIEELSSATLASLDKAAFSSRAFAWHGRKTVERNIEILNRK